jgi:hypothetical protein
MKWIFLVFVLLNVVLYWWVSEHLASEVELEIVGTLEAPIEGMELVHEQKIWPAGEQGYKCMRIGPFSTADTFSRASRSLINEGFGFTRNLLNTRELRNFRVYLGPFTTQSAMETAELRLAQQGLDFYEFEDKEGSLLSVEGLFSDGERAGAYVAKLKHIGIDAKARSEVRTLGPWRWLEVSDVVTDERRDVLRGINWRDAKVQVTGVPCT